MRQKIIITSAIILVLAIGGLVFYWQNISKPSQTLTFGYQGWLGVLPYLVAYENGYFKEKGIDLNIVKLGSYTQEMDDFLAGKIDFAGDFALIDIVDQASKGEKIKIVLATDFSNGADGIVAKKEIQNVSDLKGKKVAVEKNTLGEYLLYDALRKNNLTLSDIQEVNVSAQEAAYSFIRGEVSAAVTYEPDYSYAVEKGDGWRLYTSADSPGLIIDTLVFKDSFIKQNPQAVAAVVEAYTQGINFITNNPDKFYELAAKYFNITPVQLKNQMAGVKLMSKIDNLKIMSYGNSAGSLHGLIQQAYNFLMEKNKAVGRVDSTEIIDADFIKKLSQ